MELKKSDGSGTSPLPLPAHTLVEDSSFSSTRVLMLRLGVEFLRYNINTVMTAQYFRRRRLLAPLMGKSLIMNH